MKKSTEVKLPIRANNIPAFDTSRFPYVLYHLSLKFFITILVKQLRDLLLLLIHFGEGRGHLSNCIMLDV